MKSSLKKVMLMDGHLLEIKKLYGRICDAFQMAKQFLLMVLILDIIYQIAKEIVIVSIWSVLQETLNELVLKQKVLSQNFDWIAIFVLKLILTL